MYKCVALTDPHIQTWHLNGEGGGIYKDCYDGGVYDRVRNPYVVFNIRVSNKWMVDVCLILYKFICYTNSFYISHSFICPFSMAPASNQFVRSSPQTLKWNLVTDATDTVMKEKKRLHMNKMDFFLRHYL